MANSYDLIVIGSGPGGYIAAIRASQLGLKTAIVEREHMGGICLNWGCIPTKALLRSAEVYDHMVHAKNYGLKAEKFSADIDAIVKRSRGVTAQMSSGISFLMKKNKVDVIWGEASISAKGEVSVTKTKKDIVQPQNPIPKGILPIGKYKAKNIIIATGARPRVLSGIEPDGDKIWTYFDAMKPKKMPKSIVVMGSGAIGIEFASFIAQWALKLRLLNCYQMLCLLKMLRFQNSPASVLKNVACEFSPIQKSLKLRKLKQALLRMLSLKTAK